MKQCKQSGLIELMGYLSAKVGNQPEDQVVGGSGLGKCHDRGDKLVQKNARMQSLAIYGTNNRHELYTQGKAQKQRPETR